MKKEEEILNYAENEHKRIAEGVDDTYAEMYERGVINGALWAEDNPKEELVSIDKACEWLLNQDFDGQCFRDCDESFNNDLLVSYFRKAMEE